MTLSDRIRSLDYSLGSADRSDAQRMGNMLCEAVRIMSAIAQSVAEQQESIDELWKIVEADNDTLIVLRARQHLQGRGVA